MIRKSLYLFISFLLCQSAYSKNSSYCEKWPDWLKPVCARPYQVWTEGNTELYLTGYAWHNRYAYPEEKIGTYNEAAWGGGLGRGMFDEKGDWHALYAFAFLESHSKLEPIAGYAFLKTFHIRETTSAGLGFTVFITSRPDILNGAPFPGALPYAGFNYRRASLLAIYIPGRNGRAVGNVLFLVGKYTL